MAKRQRYLFVCTNRRPDGVPKGSCAARGAEEIHQRLKLLLRESGLAKTEVRACSCSCLDECLTGPTIFVAPDDYFYGRVSLSDLPEIVAALERGERVERLVLAADEAATPELVTP